MHKCTKCGNGYATQLPHCLMCGGEIETPERGERAEVVAVTQVSAPSMGHEEVPYSCLLLRYPDGSYGLRKSDCTHEVGSTIELDAGEGASAKCVGIVGSGLMGRGLAELLVYRGYDVVWVGRSLERLDAGAGKVFDRLLRVMDEAEVDAARKRLRLATTPDALSRCDLVIEAVIEDFEQKLRVLQETEAVLPPSTLLATNTSGLSIDDLAQTLAHPERFGALHFFNPPTRMRLVETSAGQATSAETIESLEAFVRELGKIPVRVAPRPAFVVNRVLMPLINEAVRTLEEGVAGAEDIDEAVRLGLNHPMGPLALADLIGIDVVVRIMDNLVDRTGDSAYEAHPRLRVLMDEGRLGRKSGEGFYQYMRQPQATA